MIEIITENPLEKINELSRKSVLVKGAVAYWTFPAKNFDAAFSRCLANPESFLCCDIHSPTSIDTLENFCNNGSRVFLYLYQLVGRTEVSDSKGITDHLMHSKVLVFEDGSDECWVWIGSHNGTARALLGINFECSVVFKISKTSATYYDINEHLQAIKEKSTAFDPHDKEHYRVLQGMANADAFIEVVDAHELQLTANSEISIFGAHLDDHKQLKNVGRKIYLAVTHTMSGKETFYEASITQSGELSSYNTRFDARRFAFRLTHTLPQLESKKAVPPSVYQKAKFFVTLKVGKPIFGIEAIEAPPLALWDNLSVESYISDRKISKKNADKSVRYIATDAKVKIQKARSRNGESVNNIEQIQWDRAFTVLPFEDKMKMSDHGLVRRRIIKNKEVFSPQGPERAADDDSIQT